MFLVKWSLMRAHLELAQFKVSRCRVESESSSANFQHITCVARKKDITSSVEVLFVWNMYWRDFLTKGPCTRARKKRQQNIAGKKPIATQVKKIKLQSCFPFKIANRTTLFSTLRSCYKEQKTLRHGQHMLFAKLSDSSCVLKLLIKC